MADVSARLPSRIEAGATKRQFYSTEVVKTDGGTEQRNARWSEPLAEWDIHIPVMKRNSADYALVETLFAATLGSLYSFDFHDVEFCADVEVRIKDDTIVFSGVGNLATVDMTLVEVRDDGNSP